MKATLLKQTEKAVQVRFMVPIGHSQSVITTWLPKSQLTIHSIENGLLDYDIKQWLLIKKLVDFFKFTENKNEDVQSFLAFPNRWELETFDI